MNLIIHSQHVVDLYHKDELRKLKKFSLKIRAVRWDQTPLPDAMVTVKGMGRVFRTNDEGYAIVDVVLPKRGVHRTYDLTVVAEKDVVHKSLSIYLRPAPTWRYRHDGRPSR